MGLREIQRFLRPRGSGSQRWDTRGTPVCPDRLRARAAARRRAALLRSLLLTPHMTSNQRMAMIASHQGAESAKTRRMTSRTGIPHTATVRRMFFRDCDDVVCCIPITPLLARVPCISFRSTVFLAMHGSLRGVDAADDHGPRRGGSSGGGVSSRRDAPPLGVCLPPRLCRESGHEF